MPVLACPAEFTVPAGYVLTPSMKLTVPPGFAQAGESTVLEVKVMVCPTTRRLEGGLVRVVVVGALLPLKKFSWELKFPVLTRSVVPSPVKSPAAAAPAAPLAALETRSEEHTSQL